MFKNLHRCLIDGLQIVLLIVNCVIDIKLSLINYTFSIY